MDIPSARVFASNKLTELLPNQMVMIAYVEKRKNVFMHTGRIEKVWKYPTHYEVQVAFMPKNEVSFETLYLTDYNNWESPNAWSIIKSPSAPQRPTNLLRLLWLLVFFLCIVMIVIVTVWKCDEITDYVRFGVL